MRLCEAVRGCARLSEAGWSHLLVEPALYGDVRRVSVSGCVGL